MFPTEYWETTQCLIYDYKCIIIIGIFPYTYKFIIMQIFASSFI